MFRVDGSSAVATPIARAPGSDFASWVRTRRIAALHQAGYTGRGVRVLVIDTGAAPHDQYDGQLVRLRNFTLDDGGAPEAGIDRHGHGTHVTGIVSMGAPGCDLYIAKGLSDRGVGEEQRLADAVRWGIREGVHIINASWGSASEPQSGQLQAAIREANAAGILFVAAAGNNGNQLLDRNTVTWPARWREPFVVASTWDLVQMGFGQNPVAQYSSAGPEVDVAAPGTLVYSCAPGGGWVYLSGTSMAAPMATALLACLYQQWFDMTGAFPTEPEGVVLGLWHTRDIGPAGRDVLSGVGEIDACPLVQRRRITMEAGQLAVRVETQDIHGSHAEMAVTLDAPARIEPPGHFVSQFRPQADSLGAHEVAWDPLMPDRGEAMIDVLYLGPTRHK